MTGRRIVAHMALGVWALLAGCDGLPRDPEGTLEDVRQRRVIELGMVEGAERDPAAERRLAAIAGRLGAQIRRRPGDGEHLLRELEEGRLHLVYGRFAAKSPWHTHVHLGRVPGRQQEPPGDVQSPRFAYRNGENGWIMAMEIQPEGVAR